jgi:hypothetical protein
MRKTIEEHVKDVPDAAEKTIEQVYNIIVRGYTPNTWCGPIERVGRKGNYPSALFEDTTSINLETEVAVENIIYTLTGKGHLDVAAEEAKEAEETLFEHYSQDPRLHEILEEAAQFVKRQTEYRKQNARKELEYGAPAEFVDARIKQIEGDLENTLVKIDYLMEKIQR